MAVASTGCVFINTGNSGGNNTSGVNDSILASQAVTVSQTNESDRQMLSLVDAIAKVERSAVAIKMTVSSGTGYGSGVIVDIDSEDRGEKEYYVLTCHHVISSGGDISVYLPDENLRNYNDEGYNSAYELKGIIGAEIYKNPVTLVGGDKDADVAVLKLDLSGTNIDLSTIGQVKVAPSTYSPRKGEEIFSIGNPTGLLPGTVSCGIISYVNRAETVSEVGHMNLLQFDVQTNPGNSGGGLYNMYGELIGITNAGKSSYEGINFAIPASNSQDANKDTGFINIAKQLIGTKTETNYGYVSGRWQLGVNIKEGTDVDGKYVYVSGINAGDNAANAGIVKNDIIQSIVYNVGGSDVKVDINSESSFISTVYTLKSKFRIGDSFTINVARVGRYNSYTTHSITVELNKQFVFCDTGK